MEFEFDPQKALSNTKEHGISFAEVEPVFFDEFALTREDDAMLEQRFITVGLDARLRVVIVCWTQRGNNIRLNFGKISDSQ